MKTYFRILTYVKPYWKHLGLSVISTILFALLNGASIYLTIPLLSTLFQEEQIEENINSQPQTDIADSFLPDWLSTKLDSFVEAFNNLIFSGETETVLVKICFLILFAFLGKNIFGYLQAYFLAYAEQGVIKDLRNQTYAHLHQLPMSFFKKEKTGNLISRITNDVNVVQASISAVFLNMIREPITIIVFLAIAISISWELTIFSFIVLPFSLVIIVWIGLILRKQSAIIQSKMADITNVLHETITGVKIVKAFGKEEYENKKFTSETYKYFKLVLRMIRIRNVASPVTEFLSVVVGVVIIFYGGKLVLIDHTIKASEFLGFLFAIFQLMPPIKELGTINNRIQESSAAGDRVFEILDTKPNIIDSKNAINYSEFKNKIEFKNVCFSYDDSEELVLNSINFTATKGEVIALVGSSGGGKTTLSDLIPRFFDPTSGVISIDDIDSKSIKLKDLRSLMGIVTQETVLFNESVKANIAYGLENYPDDKVVEVAKAANAHRFIKELPKGYDTIIGEKGTKLSGGQRQRISIARALLKNPPIMIFDEATSALDNESEILVQEAIERLMKTRTTFVIAHRLSTIRNADKILVIEKGKIVQQGKHDELIKEESGIYKKLYELQFRNI
ncbi:MAG: ABC transporter transmembrane domain-containing protein [Melioribacteraceae bacterium]